MLSFSGLVLLLAIAPAHAEEGMVTVGGPAAPTGDYYVIQPGDTLWSISSRFLNDSYAWPQLWSLNEYITNPHWIYPGNRIYFRLQDHLTPPSATPDAFLPQPDALAVAPSDDSCDFPVRFVDERNSAPLLAPGVVSTAEDLNLRGTIYAADEHGSQLGEPSYVYLDIADGDVKCGDSFSVFRLEQKKVRSRDVVIGSMYRILGEVQVFRVDGHIATGRIRASYFEMERGDLVGDLLPVALTLDVRAPAEDKQAEIIARLNGAQQLLANIDETVFLDRGTTDGIEVGDSLFIVERRDPIHLDDRADESLPERVVGRVIVVRTTDDASTAVVVNAARDVQVGQQLTTRPNKSTGGDVPETEGDL